VQGLRRLAGFTLATTILFEYAHCQSSDACGTVVLAEDFENYPGDWQPYTKALAQGDFGAIEKVGDRKLNLIYLSGEERGSVGSGTLRSTHPAGVSSA
jgi:hypothetical protein